MVDMTEKIPPHKGLDKRMSINVGGVRHETFLSTLEKIPGTRLALLARLQVVKTDIFLIATSWGGQKDQLNHCIYYSGWIYCI